MEEQQPEKLTVVQASVPVSVATAIETEANSQMPPESVSRIIARVLCAHYAKAARKSRKVAA